MLIKEKIKWTEPVDRLLLIWTHKSNASRSEEDKSDYKCVDSTSDLDEDGNPVWDPAISPGV